MYKTYFAAIILIILSSLLYSLLNEFHLILYILFVQIKNDQVKLLIWLQQLFTDTLIKKQSQPLGPLQSRPLCCCPLFPSLVPAMHSSQRKKRGSFVSFRLCLQWFQ